MNPKADVVERRGGTAGPGGHDGSGTGPGRSGLLGRLSLRRGGRAGRVQRRFERRLRARRWRAWRRVLVLLAVVAVVVTGVWLVFFSSVLAVHHVAVKGTAVLSEDTVRGTAAVPYDVPLATSDLDAVQARVEDLPAVRSVEVSRSWPDTVTIDVTERVAVAAVPWEGGWRGVDDEGVLFRDYAERPADLPLLQVRAATPASALAEAARVVESLPADLSERVESLKVTSIDGITLQLKAGRGSAAGAPGPQVRWGSADDSAEKAKVLGVLLEQPARIYNVQAPGRPTITR